MAGSVAVGAGVAVAAGVVVGGVVAVAVGVVVGVGVPVGSGDEAPSTAQATPLSENAPGAVFAAAKEALNPTLVPAPAAIREFQPASVTATVRPFWSNLPFQPWATVWPSGKDQRRVHPSISAAPALRTVRFAVNSPVHCAVTAYVTSQAAPPGAAACPWAAKYATPRPPIGRLTAIANTITRSRPIPTEVPPSLRSCRSVPTGCRRGCPRTGRTLRSGAAGGPRDGEMPPPRAGHPRARGRPGDAAGHPLTMRSRRDRRRVSAASRSANARW